MIKIGLTGGIGSGKSYVAQLFIDLGIPVYLADIEAKKLMQSSKKIKKELIKAFGKESYIGEQLNRSYLAGLVFNDKEKLKLINSIVHPEVNRHFSAWVNDQKAPYIIQENAILFENDQAQNFDAIITVTAPLEERIKRVMKRDLISRQDVISRIKNQWDDKDKIKHSDFVIENMTRAKTKNEVKKLHKFLLNQYN